MRLAEAKWALGPLSGGSHPSCTAPSFCPVASCWSLILSKLQGFLSAKWDNNASVDVLS